MANLGTIFIKIWELVKENKYERHRIREMVYEYFETKQFKIYKSECDLECLDIQNSYANCSLLGFRGTNFALYSAGRTVNDGTFSEDGGSRGLAGKTCTSKLNFNNLLCTI